MSKYSFFDDCSFLLNGTAIHQNCRYFSDFDPRRFRDVHLQLPETLRVWIGIFDNNIVPGVTRK